MKNQIISILLLATFGCGNGFQSGGSSSTQDPKNVGHGDGADPTPQPSSEIPEKVAFELNGFISGGQFSKHPSVVLDRMNKELVFRLPLPSSVTVSVSPGEISRYPGIKYGTDISSSGILSIYLRVPLKYVVRGIEGIDSKRLPNGDPLPGIYGGELPILGFTNLNQNGDAKLYVYLNTDNVGIFVETKFNPTIPAFFAIKNSTEYGSHVIGSVSFIPAKSPYRGGFFLSFNLPGELNEVLTRFLGN